MEKNSNVSQLIVGYLHDPFIIWTIIFETIIHLSVIQVFADIAKWILESQIYLVIFTTSFVYSYFKQSYPIYKKIQEIKKAKLHDKLAIPRIMSYKTVLDILLWLGGGVLFFADLMMSFGVLYPNAIANKTTYSQLELELPMLGFVCIPIVSGYYNRYLSNYFKKLGIILEKIDSEIMIPLLTTTFFITLSYVAVVNILPK